MPPRRKTYNEQLRPTPAQVRELERILWRCRARPHGPRPAQHALPPARHQRGLSVSGSTQDAELKGLRAAYPDYAAIHSPVLQDVLARLDRTSQAFQAFFRRVQTGEQPGFPRVHGKDRSHSVTSQEYGNGAQLETG